MIRVETFPSTELTTGAASIVNHSTTIYGTPVFQSLEPWDLHRNQVERRRRAARPPTGSRTDRARFVSRSWRLKAAQRSHSLTWRRAGAVMAGVRLEYPAGYYARARRSSLELRHVNLGLIADGFDDEIDAIFAAQEHDEAIEAEEPVLIVEK